MIWLFWCLQVKCNPAELSPAAEQAGADCELSLTLVASCDAAKVSRAGDKVTTFAIGFGGDMPNSNMLPVGMSVCGDSQKDLHRAFGTSPGDGVDSLFKQVDRLKPFLVNLPPNYFNYRNMWLDPKLAAVFDQPCANAISGTGALCT